MKVRITVSALQKEPLTSRSFKSFKIFAYETVVSDNIQDALEIAQAIKDTRFAGPEYSEKESSIWVER